MNRQSLVFLGLLTCSFVSYGQSCPHGYMPLGGQQAGWVGCAPIGGANQSPPDPGPQWQSRWGAIATTNGAFGVANGMSSKRKASKAALADCKRNGGSKCKVSMVFYNQCGALAWGDTGNTTFNSPHLEDAERSAVEGCGEHSANCKLYYSACSYPVQVR